ncbi:MAG TPA: TIGR00303 family protein [Methanothrix sp.]|nr:TIGR00303 family protein [Methanothrix sp.]HOV82185.1 TIGR00303 family protein [Methanothrix sp.]HPC90019.1 TIGR00303 family protein [Methanothrix sp.]HQE88016.1 TIGR00303 family protein [Methanothrix sp.]HQI68492.1 TIGR00303 family protein [Methanothrix sp.]
MPEWIYPNFEFRPQRPLFLCIISNTDTGKIPGLSAAGTTPELTDYTPGADAELVETNRIITMPELPEAPGGSPTPAIVTRAALNLTAVPSLIAASGLRKKPAVPFVELGGAAGSDIRKEPGVPAARSIYENAAMLGRKLARLSDCVFIAESIAGGTTTALAVLRALGYDCNVSSSFQSNPSGLKEQVVSDALQRSGIKRGSLKSDPMRAVEQLGDPMMPAALGLMKGLQGCKVVLSGGTQMAAVLALGMALGIDGDISIATTKYIIEDKTANFTEIVESTGRPYYCSDPGLEHSTIPSVQIYAQGYVKEGVGMGGAALLAGLYGVGQRQLVAETDRVLMTVELPKK